MRIVHLITSLATGGAETMLARLMEGRQDRRFVHHVVAIGSGGAPAERIRAAGVPVTLIELDPRRPNPFKLLRLWWVLRQLRPDLLQSWLYHADLLASCLRPWVGRPRLVWGLRCSDMDLSRYAVTTRWIVGQLARWSDRPDLVISNSAAGLAAHQALGWRPRRSRIIPNGVDTDIFHPDSVARARIRAELSIGDDVPLIGMVARFDPMKDHAGLLAAASQMDHRVHWLLAGRGVEAGAVAIPPILAGRVHLLGERSDVPALMAALDGLVVASAFGEGFPNVLIEAMACGVPCVATDTGDAAAILAGVGRVVPPGDPLALAAAIQSMLTALATDPVRDHVLAHYRLAQVVTAFEAAWAEVLE